LFRMNAFSLKCHTLGAAAPPSSFFILSKGNNAGRPAHTPNPNCFVFTCNPEDKDAYFWLVYALWDGGKFRQYLCGSVIYFLHIRHVRECIEYGQRSGDRITTAAAHLQKLLALETNLKSQLALLREARRAIVRRALTRPAV
jgi:hypothetical protein